MEALDVLWELVLRAVHRSPYLTVFSVGFWATVASGLFLRYVRHDRALSERVLRVTLVIGVLAVITAAVDLAVRGTVEVIHPSMVAYLAVPIGAGRRVLTRLDAMVATRRWRQPTDPTHELRHLARRQSTYLTALGLDMLLAAIAGDPYRLGSRVTLDRDARPRSRRSTGCT